MDVVAGDILQLNCSVSYADYFGYLTAQYDWAVVNDSERQRVQIISTTAAKNSGVASVMASWSTVPRLRCSVYFNHSGRSSYSDAASNTPRYSGQCTTSNINVLSGPRDVQISRTASDDGGRHRLRCRASGRPAPMYEWHRVPGGSGDDDDDDDGDQLLASGDSLLLTDAGRHQVRCTAVNDIRGVQHRASSDVVVINVPPPTRQSDTDMITDCTVGWHRRYSRTTTGSVNETTVYKGSGILRRLTSNEYFVPGTCGVAAVVLLTAVSTIVAVVIRCSRTQARQVRADTGAAVAVSTWTNTQEHGLNDEALERSDELNTDDDARVAEDAESLSAAVYDEIVSGEEPTSEQYNELVMSDVLPVAESAAGVDVYCPLQRDTSTTITTTTSITITIGKRDVRIVFNDDSGTPGTTPSSHQTHADSPTSTS